MRIWLVVILGAILSGISYAAYEFELRATGSGRVASLPLATSDKDSSAQNRESILGEADKAAESVEPDTTAEAVDAPTQATDARVAAGERSGEVVAPLAAVTAEVKPTFDVVSVDPDGTAVVAGRAAPGASVTLQIGDKAIGSALASDRGEWVIIPDELIPGGAQSLSLEATSPSGGEPVKSAQVATIVLPDATTEGSPVGGSPAAGGLSEVDIAASQASSADTTPAPAEVPVAVPDRVAGSASSPAPGESEPTAVTADATPAPAEAPVAVPDRVAESGSTPAPSEVSPTTSVGEAASSPIVVAEAAREVEAARPDLAVVAETAPAAPTVTAAEEPLPTPGQADSRQELASLPVAPTADGRSEDTAGADTASAARTLLGQPAGAAGSAGEVQSQSTAATSEQTKGDGSPATAPIASITPNAPAPAAAAPSQGEGSSSRSSGAMVVLSQPGEASRVLQSGEQPQAAPPPITFDSVDYDDAGRVIVAGQVEAGADVRAYINNEILGDAQANEQGRWTLRATRDIKPGAYELRVDQIDQAGLVIARASAPFRPVSPDIVARARARGEVVIQPGDNLWTIARNLYGQGTLYTVIYNANTNQIIDPDLIYPGQLLMTPGSSGLDHGGVAAGQSG